MRFAAVASLAFIGVVAAQNSTTNATGCVAKYDTCRTTRVNGLSANQAKCASDNAACQGACYAALSTCQTSRGPDGSSANQAACFGQYATCLGENPIASTGGIISSFIPYTATVSANASSTSAAASASVTGSCKDQDNTCRITRVNGLPANQAQCSANNAACQGICYASYNACRTTRSPDGLSANPAQCTANYAACLGENPVASSGGLISSFLPYSATVSSSAATDAAVYITKVVTAITTVCPAPTAGPYTTTINNNVYTVSSATTIIITDCPCTISSKAPAASTASGMGGTKSGTATVSKPAVYTGAAVARRASIGFLGVAAGAVMLL